MHQTLSSAPRATMPARTLAATLAMTLVLAGCSMGPSSPTATTGPMIAQPDPTATLQQPTTTAALPTTTAAASGGNSGQVAMTDATSYLDPAVVGRLSSKELSEAASAQFNALTFGRPGAPRTWSGDRGAAGQVVVGPYVRVNNIDCRDFTHTVTVGGTPFVKKGTACREADGTWKVAA